MKYLYFIILIVGCSCNKETVSTGAPSLIGSWKHYSAESDWHILHIQDNSEGYMEWYTNGSLYKDTKVRTWYLKDNTIYFGKVALNGELYEVIDYPQVAGSESIELFDTLKPGKRYMKLNKGYYIEI